MSFEPDFLSLDDVLLIHEQQLARYGGSSGIRDQGLLESAIAQPRQVLEVNLFMKVFLRKPQRTHFILQRISPF